jgi:hypothetical protein
LSLPFFSNFPLAKLYSRFVFEKQVILRGEPMDLQFANFMSYDTFKFQQGKLEMENGVYRVNKNLVAEGGKIYIHTNSQSKLKQWDIVWLIHPLFPQGQFFFISESVLGANLTHPSPSNDLQGLTLETTILDEINIKHLWIDREVDNA